MAEETKDPQEQIDIDYIAAIQELRTNSVPKEQFEKLKEDNAKLLKSLINGETIDSDDLPASPDVQELRNKLFAGEVSMSNLEYCQTALRLRDTLIEQGERDPFLPFGHHISPDRNDVEAAERVATVMKECIDAADGDSDVFTALLQRQMSDQKIK